MRYYPDRVTLSWSDQSRVASNIGAAIDAAVEAEFKRLSDAAEAEAKQNEKNRKDFAKHMTGSWTESFDLCITRFGTIYGCNAHVVRRDAPYTYEVYQNAHRFNTDEPPQWLVKKAWHDPNRGYVDTVIWDWASEDFEAVIRRCAVDLMGWS